MNGGESPLIFSFGIIIVVLATVAIVVSALVAYVGFRKRRAAGPDTILLIIMSLMDMLMGFTWIITFMSRMFQSTTSVTDPDSPICIFQSILYVFTLEVSSDCALLLALLRFLVIVLNWNPHRKLWILFASCTFLFSAVTSGLSYYYRLISHMPSTLYCMPVTTSDIPFARFYGIWLFMRVLLIPIVIMICYTAISLRYYTVLSHLTTSNNSCCLDNLNVPEVLDQKSMKYKMKRPIFTTILRLSLASVAYAAIFLPSVIICISQLITKIPNTDPNIDALSLLSSLLIIVVNPLFAMVAHEETRHELHNMFADDPDSN